MKWFCILCRFSMVVVVEVCRLVVMKMLKLMVVWGVMCIWWMFVSWQMCMNWVMFVWFIFGWMMDMVFVLSWVWVLNIVCYFLLMVSGMCVVVVSCINLLMFLVWMGVFRKVMLYGLMVWVMLVVFLVVWFQWRLSMILMFGKCVCIVWMSVIGLKVDEVCILKVLNFLLCRVVMVFSFVVLFELGMWVMQVGMVLWVLLLSSLCIGWLRCLLYRFYSVMLMVVRVFSQKLVVQLCMCIRLYKVCQRCCMFSGLCLCSRGVMMLLISFCIVFVVMMLQVLFQLMLLFLQVMCSSSVWLLVGQIVLLLGLMRQL